MANQFTSSPSMSEGFLFSTFLATLIIFCLLIITILIDVWRHFIVVLICFSLVISDVEHLFMSSVAICISSLEKCPFQCSVHFCLFLKLKNDLAVLHLWGHEWAFSSWNEWQLLSSGRTRASLCGGDFSRYRARALECSLSRCGARA